ncbi:DUF6448 family protein [Phenylobacterium sp.]|jgi:hypothetical protein|uniref:DUF6448 family protein n=1 Tax=Phenylobacterium sp. TaxID=1871053 RepID=UPI002ED8B0BB
MTAKPAFLGMLIGVGLCLAPMNARAHCDTLDGPVAMAAQRALEAGNVNLVLPYAPATAEAEIRAAFDKSRRVRGLGAEARTIADLSFVETVVRLHRVGEGVSYTGLRPAGLDAGPAIPAAEAAVASGDLAKLKAVLQAQVEHALSERLAHVRETQEAPAEARTPAEVAQVRERVRAELAFVTFAEGIRQAALGAAGDHHQD